MKQLALLLVLGLMAASILACGGDSADPTEAAAPTAAATQPPAAPTEYARPDPGSGADGCANQYSAGNHGTGADRTAAADCRSDRAASTHGNSNCGTGPHRDSGA